MIKANLYHDISTTQMPSFNCFYNLDSTERNVHIFEPRMCPEMLLFLIKKENLFKNDA